MMMLRARSYPTPLCGRPAGRRLLLGLLLAGLLGIAAPVQAQLVVTTTADTDDGECVTDCSLREAIDVATTGATITFAPALNGATIMLGGTQLLIDKNLTIDTEGQAVTVDADGLSRVFQIGALTSSSREVTLRGLTITGGDGVQSGGGIAVPKSNTLHLEGATVTGNTADDGNATTVDTGGGIRVDGTLFVTNSTISGNAAEAGGGIYAANATVTVTASTITDNTANGGGGVVIEGDIGSFTLASSLVAGNTAPDRADCVLVARGSFTSSGQNLFGSGSACPSGTGDQFVDPADVFTTVLSPTLDDNGGPNATHLLLPGSPALDTGACNGLMADQRGFAREVDIAYATDDGGDACDVGAVENTLAEATFPDLVVDTMEDPGDGSCSDGDCALRDAIVLVASGGTITFDESLDGQTITLGGTQLVIDTDVVIDTEGQAVTVDADGLSRVFQIGDVNDSEVTLRGLTITGGSGVQDGGGIFVLESNTLHLEGATVTGNTADDEGGGILAFGTLFVTNSTISGNAATFGGGIYAGDNTVTVTASTITDNSASQGGGVFILSSIGSRSFTLASSLVAGNTASSGADCVQIAGTFTSSGQNLFGSGSQCPSGTGDQVVDPADVFTTVLSPTLDDNGGPSPTHLLLPGSPALDTGACHGLTQDQRGFAREVDIGYAGDNGSGDNCDVGAVEATAEEALDLVVDTTEDPGDGDCFDDGDCALRDAIDLVFPGGLIRFAPALDGQTITLGGTQLVIDTDVVIDTEGQAVTVDADGLSRVFQIGDVNDSEVTLRGLTITGGSGVQDGGGIFVLESNTLHLEGATVTGNTADDSNPGSADYGGGIAVFGTLFVTNSTISGNATGSGGGIYATNATVTVTASTITDNTADAGGGVFFDGFLGGSFTLSSSLVAGNTATFSDADCALVDGSFTSSGQNLFGSGSACPSGTGDQFVDPADVFTTVLSPTLDNNGGPSPTHLLLPGSPALDTGACNGLSEDQRGLPRNVDIAYADDDGGDACDVGAVENTLAEATFPDLVVDTTEDPGDGSCSDGDCALRDAITLIASGGTITFDESLDGATITLMDGQLLIDTDVVIDTEGQAVTVDADGLSRVFQIGDVNDSEVTLRGLTITGGSGVQDGGGILVNSTNTLHLEGATVTGNTANDGNAGTGDYGGGIRVVSSGTLFVTNSTISGNAADNGGGIYAVNATVTVTASTITDNTAAAGGGVAFEGISGSFTLASSLVAGNTATSFDADCTLEFGSPVTSSGQNLFGSGSQCPSGTGDQFVDPADVFTTVLSPTLSNNGGPSQTHLLLPGSPALDTGACHGLSEDQRGLPRNVDIGYADDDGGDACDVGAVEATAEEALDLLVDTTEDPGDGDCFDDDCALRDAIDLVFPGGLIRFAPVLDGQTITLGGSQLLIDKNLTIDTEGQAVTVDADGLSRVFQIGDVNDSEVTLRGLTITGGGNVEDGGGIFVPGSNTLHLEGATVTGNTAADGNPDTSDQGGGIFAQGSTLFVTNSTISGNLVNAGGGGIYAADATVTVTASTITDNKADIGGGVFFDGDTGSFTLSSSLVAGNIASSDADCATPDSFTSSGQNLFGHGSDCPSDPTDQHVDPADVFTTVLSPTLSDNGGPSPTHLLLPGSPALDTGACNGLSEDQRGLPRNVDIAYADDDGGDACDVGAVENTAAEASLSPTELVVDTTEDPGDGSCSDGDCALRDAIALIAPGGTITFDPSLNGQTITLSGQLLIDTDVVIDSKAQTVTIEGAGLSRFLPDQNH